MFETSFEVRQTAAGRIFNSHLGAKNVVKQGLLCFDTSLKRRQKYPAPHCILHSLLNAWKCSCVKKICILHI